MKFVKIGLLSIAASISTATFASNYNFVAGDDSLETQICISAVKNDLYTYHSKVKKLGYSGSLIDSRKHTIVANKLLCNEQNIVSFARSYDADKVADYLANYLKPSVIIRRNVADKPADTDEAKVIVVTANR